MGVGEGGETAELWAEEVEIDRVEQQLAGRLRDVVGELGRRGKGRGDGIRLQDLCQKRRSSIAQACLCTANELHEKTSISYSDFDLILIPVLILVWILIHLIHQAMSCNRQQEAKEGAASSYAHHTCISQLPSEFSGNEATALPTSPYPGWHRLVPGRIQRCRPPNPKRGLWSPYSRQALPAFEVVAV